MSSAYTTEPPTKGKVVLKTSLGDLEVELWPKEAPLATRNFVQLCLEGYYDGCIFHRVVKDFIVQSGDPTATGSGGESIYGEPFADEFHSRLRFSHRGLLAMANTGRHSNKSQFFFTLDKTEELTRKNTIFGKIVGNTIYNLLEIGLVDVDPETDRPIYPVIINSVEVIYNPFDDITPRTTAEERRAKMAEEKIREEKLAAKKSTVPRKKNFSLLSFGEEAESEEVGLQKLSSKKIKSSHDLLDDARLSKEAALDVDPVRTTPATTDAEAVASKISEKLAKAKERTTTPASPPPKRVWDDGSEESDSDSEERERTNFEKSLPKKPKPDDNASNSKLLSVRSEIEKVQNSLKQMDKSRRTNTRDNDSGQSKPLNPLEAMRAEYKGKAIMGRRLKGSQNNSDILKSLESFKEKLSRPARPIGSSEELKDEKLCTLHGLKKCLSCKRDEEDVMNSDDDEGWFHHELHFQKDPANVYAPTIDDYSYFDPRDPKSIDEYKASKRDNTASKSRDWRPINKTGGSERPGGRSDQWDRRGRDYDRNREYRK